MNNELNHSKHPFKLRLFWIAVYVLIASSILFSANTVANQFRTHTLPVGSVTLNIPYSKYVVGEKINFTIRNKYNSSIYVMNNCPSEPLAVYMKIKDKWVRQNDEASLKECPTEQRQVTIKAGETTTGTFAPWHNLFKKPGKYRIVAFVEYYNSLPYQDIEVIAKSKPETNTKLFTTAQPAQQWTAPAPKTSTLEPVVVTPATPKTTSPPPEHDTELEND